jgi:pimeloyl-ACP methyl ester carboxylesterase
VRDLPAAEGLVARRVGLPGGRGLRVVEAGEGGPLVVFEAGGGACASEWSPVQRIVAAHTRTVSYDRAGYGGSDVDPRPRTLPNLARDLVDLLDTLGESRPVILVAHSWGGPIARALSLEHPERVAGLVFVDATVSGLMSTRAARLASGMAAVQVALATLRIPNPLVRMLAATFGPDFPDGDRQLMLRDYADKQSTVAFRREAKEIAGALDTLAQWEVKGHPTVAITSVVGGTPTRGQTKLRADLIEHERAEMRRHDGTLVVVDGAGHHVPLQRPRELAQAVIDLTKRVRAAEDTG